MNKNVLLKLDFEDIELEADRKDIRFAKRMPMEALHQIPEPDEKPKLEPIEFVTYKREQFGYGKDIRFNMFISDG